MKKPTAFVVLRCLEMAYQEKSKLTSYTPVIASQFGKSLGVTPKDVRRVLKMKVEDVFKEEIGE